MIFEIMDVKTDKLITKVSSDLCPNNDEDHIFIDEKEYRYSHRDFHLNNYPYSPDVTVYVSEIKK